MKQKLSIVLSVVFVVSLIVLSFTYLQANSQSQSLTDDLERRSILLTESFRESIQPLIINQNQKGVQKVVNKYENQGRLLGLVVYDNKDNVIAQSSTMNTLPPHAREAAITSMDQDDTNTGFDSDETDDKVFITAIPLHGANSTVIGSLVSLHNADYIDRAVLDVWESGLLRVLSYSLIISLLLLFVIYWFLSRPLVSMVENIKRLRTGTFDPAAYKLTNNRLFEPLFKEFSSIQSSLVEARSAASYEARLRLEKLDSPWTAERLKEFTKEMLKGRPLFVVSNREPYIHTRKDGKLEVTQPASGMVTALEPTMKASGGVWFAHGSGDADREVVDRHSKVKVPPDDPQFSLRRVWLNKEEEQGYYYGFSNDGLWPLCHIAHVEPIFRKSDWDMYTSVNEKFARIILREIKDIKRPLIFIQDYHFTLLPRLIKRQRPDAVIAVFWHIPWPGSESFRICPWTKEILDGMLGADLLCFHTQLHANNFIDTVGRELESLIDMEQFAVQRAGNTSYVKPFPIGIPYPEENGTTEEVFDEAKKNQFLKSLNIPAAKFIGVGVDRMDYTKGILERLRAIELFLSKYPEYKEQFTFIQIAPSSRSTILSYKRYSTEVLQEVDRINNKFKKRNWKPIVLINKHQDHSMIEKVFRVSNVCLVTSLHDGMNLVAMEYPAARNDEQGVLILSQFTGASRELREAIIVNPYAVEEVADAIKEALEMPEADQRRRMKRLRQTIENNNVYRWAAEILREMAHIRSMNVINTSLHKLAERVKI